MRVEVGVKESSKQKYVGRTWAGHVKKGDEKLVKRAVAPKVEGNWRQGRPKLRWGIALKVT